MLLYCKKTGSYEQARLAIEQVLDNAKSLDDKMTAYIHQLYCEEKETSDYARIAVDGSKILNMYGCGIPSTLTKVTMMKEEAKFKLALKKSKPLIKTHNEILQINKIFELFPSLALQNS